METEVKLTKLASCAGCGAKVGAGTLVHLLEGFRTHSDPRLLVGYDRSDDASVYYLDENTALVQTTDFFPPIVDDPFLYGQIAAANAISDVYAMGGEPRLALNILCLPESMTGEMVQELLRGGYDKAYEAGAIITGGHTIHGAEPIYGLAVSGFVHPKRILTNSGAKPGDVLLLTKPLGVGVLTTAAKAGLVEETVMQRIYRQMAALNKTARDIMVKYRVHSCTDVTGFALLGHIDQYFGVEPTVNNSTQSLLINPANENVETIGFKSEENTSLDMDYNDRQSDNESSQSIEASNTPAQEDVEYYNIQPSTKAILIDLLDNQLKDLNIIRVTNDDLVGEEPAIRNAKGFIKDGQIYINIDKATVDTVIHEFAHLYLAAAKNGSNSQAYYEILSELPQTEL